jgi:hypothetical protein
MRIASLLLLSLLVATSAHAQSGQSSTALAERLMDLGADGIAIAQMAAPPEDALAALETQQPEVAALFRRAWREGFGNGRLRTDVVHHLASRNTTGQIEAAQAWMRRPAVQQAVTAFRRTMRPEEEAALQQWAARLTERDLDRARVDRVARIVERSGGVQRSVELALRASEASLRAAAAMEGPTAQAELPNLLREVEASRDRLTVALEIQSRVFVYYALRDVSLADLDAYAQELHRPEGRWYVGAMLDAMDYALTRAMERYDAALAAGR